MPFTIKLERTEKLPQKLLMFALESMKTVLKKFLESISARMSHLRIGYQFLLTCKTEV